MTIFTKFLKTVAAILTVAVLLQLFVLVLRLDTEDQKFRTGEITAGDTMNYDEMLHTLAKTALLFFASLIIAGIAYILETSRKISDDIDDLPEQIPVIYIENERKK